MLDFSIAAQNCWLLHLAGDQVSGHSLHLKTKAAGVKLEAVVAYDRGQDHLGEMAYIFYSRVGFREIKFLGDFD